MMIKVVQFFDSHFHGRNGELLRAVIRHLGNQCCVVLFMCNLNDEEFPGGVLTADDVKRYLANIRAAGFGGQALMTIKLTPATTPEIIRVAHQAGVTAAKLYPDGVTTGSQDGVRDFRALDSDYEEMESCGMHALFHGEMPDSCVLDAERDFLPELQRVARNFPRLKITLEHITTKAAVQAVMALPKNVSATITAHHLRLVIDDVIGAKIRPHNFCKPVAKRWEDLKALLEAAFSGNPKFRFGSDSAPHRKGAKECAQGCAGVYTGPILVPLVCDTFDNASQMPKLHDFTVTFGADWFELDAKPQTLEVIREQWLVPAELDGVVPFMAGQKLNYRLGKPQ